MTSENKKRKAKNSYIWKGAEKYGIERWKCKRIAYYTKRDRKFLNKEARNNQST